MLLDSWRGQLGSFTILEAWRMIPLCLMWWIWRVQNARSFEDYENLAEELKNIMFKSLYTWIGEYNSSNFSEFLDFCSLLFSSISGFSCILLDFLCNKIVPLCAFNDFDLLIKKKKLLSYFQAVLSFHLVNHQRRKVIFHISKLFDAFPNFLTFSVEYHSLKCI